MSTNSEKRKTWCQVNKLTQKQNEEGLLKVLEKNAVNQEMICIFKLGCTMHIFNSYSSRTCRIWADIYNQRGHSYYQLIYPVSPRRITVSKFSSSPITGNCHSKFFPTSSNRDIFFTDDTAKKFFPSSKISAQEIRHQFFLIWSNLTIMAHIMGLGNQSESWKIIILS